MKLNELSNIAGARKKRMRVGRGPGTGKGRTAGRGMNGQKSRSGVAIKGFEGGQMPIHMRLPKRGFNKPNRLKFSEVNVGRLQEAVDAGKLDAKATVTAEALVEAGVVRRTLDGVRILGNGTIKAGLTLEVAGASKGAIEAIEKAGGKVTVTKPVQETAPAAEKKAGADA